VLLLLPLLWFLSQHLLSGLAAFDVFCIPLILACTKHVSNCYGCCCCVAAGDYDEKAVRAKIEGMIKDNKVQFGKQRSAAQAAHKKSNAHSYLITQGSTRSTQETQGD
jgi:hypothetical protein